MFNEWFHLVDSVIMNNKAHLSRHSGCNPSDVLIFVELVNVIRFYKFVETISSISKDTKKICIHIFIFSKRQRGLK